MTSFVTTRPEPPPDAAPHAAGRQALGPSWLGPRSGFHCAHRILLAGLWLLLTCSGQAAAPLLSTNAPSVPTTFLPDAGFSVIRVFGALTLVLALFLGGVWLFKNWQRLALQHGRVSQLQIVEMKALGGKHVLYVVGYQQQRLLLAASPAGVSLVSHLPVADTTELEPAQSGTQQFVQVLQQAVQGHPPAAR